MGNAADVRPSGYTLKPMVCRNKWKRHKFPLSCAWALAAMQQELWDAEL